MPTDGRAVPRDPNPQWFGTSIGRWDGDTLVIETRGFNGWTRLDTIGHPHSDQLHLTQTFRRTDADRIAYTVTVDDPVIYTKPWKNERVLTRQKGELIEYSCEENNKDLRKVTSRRGSRPQRNTNGVGHAQTRRPWFPGPEH